MDIKIKKLNPNAIIPTNGSEYAAGWDLYACEDAKIAPGNSAFIHTGIAIEIPEGYFGAIYARSGLACKQGLRPANCVGVIDSDYRGEIQVCLHNDDLERFTERFSFNFISKGDRIAQLIIQKYEPINFIEVDELEDTSRGDGGFGSSGK
jgi:dUTP pyrophosphatase